MKHQKMINWIKYQLVNTPNIHMDTAKRFIEKYIECMSSSEYTQYKSDILLVKLFTNKQITIDKFAKQLNLKNLEKEFNNLIKKTK